MPKGPQPVDPKLLEKSLKPTMTIAMGLKLTHTASVCWKDQVAKEERLRHDWNEIYRPDWAEEERAIIERVKQREEQKRLEAASRPEREILLDGVSKEGKGRLAYLKERHKMNPQEKFDHPPTMSTVVGWTATEPPAEVNPNDPWRRKKGGGGAYRRPQEMEGMY
mmetsp:Transcript_34642/g.40505  ORF Transcript_34642/g.40505 Transcript_34642/m.40505 type:complete len:165 (+) Transcript_34642:101-595(+)